MDKNLLKIGYDVIFDDEGTILAGYIWNTNFAKRPNTIEVMVVDGEGNEFLADLVPIDKIKEVKRPDGTEFAYLDEE